MGFGDIDANLDGKISQQEWSDAYKSFGRAIADTRAAALSGLDTLDSGKLSEYEAKAGKGRWMSLWDRAIQMAIAANDKNSAGELSDDEGAPVVKRLQMVVNRYNLRIP